MPTCLGRGCYSLETSPWQGGSTLRTIADLFDQYTSTEVLYS